MAARTVENTSLDPNVLDWMKKYEAEQKRMGHTPSQAWYDAMYRLAQL